MLNTLRAVNMLNGAVLITMAILLLVTGAVNLNFATFTISAYVTAFGVIMMVVECHLQNLQACVRAQCGFLFSYWGRAVFIIL